jgi:chromosome partitioning protein
MTAAEAAAAPVRLTAPWVIAVASQKGGVGKTTLALGLAAVTADSSGRPLVVDVDPQGSATEVAESAGDDLPFDFTAESDPAVLGQLRQARDIDTVIIDCPGSLEGQDVLGQVLAAADLVIIPMIPERASITPTVRTARLAEAAGVPYRVVLNQVDPLRGAGPVESAWELLDRQGLPRFSSLIRRYVAHSQSQLDGVMITGYRGDKSWRNALDDMRRLHAELLLTLGRMAQERLP